MLISNQIPIIQILIPFISALCCVIITNIVLVKNLAITSSIINWLLSIYSFKYVKIDLVYNFGNWSRIAGIEYKLDYLSKFTIIHVNTILLIFLLCCNKLIKSDILEYIDNKRQHLFYAVLLFVQCGNLGMVSTNDLFNLYVFLEITSIATCIILVSGNKKHSVIGSFDYLTLNTIAATLILLGICFLLNVSGSLNINEIYKGLIGNYSSRLTIAGISLILTGFFLKMAFFPLNFWLTKIYMTANSTILCYLASISSIVIISITLRFVHFAIDFNAIRMVFSYFFKPLVLISIVFCSVFALKANSIKKVIVYASFVQVSYALLFLLVDSDSFIILKMLSLDGINKFALFFILSEISNSYFKSKSKIRGDYYNILIIINLLCSAGFPISSMFIIKSRIIKFLFEKELMLEALVLIISFCISLLYYYKIADKIFYELKHRFTSYNNSRSSMFSLLLITTIQFLYF